MFAKGKHGYCLLLALSSLAWYFYANYDRLFHLQRNVYYSSNNYQFPCQSDLGNASTVADCLRQAQLERVRNMKKNYKDYNESADDLPAALSIPAAKLSKLRFEGYISSPLEVEWATNIDFWQKKKKFCPAVRSQREIIDKMLMIRDEMMYGVPMNRIVEKYSQETVDHIFSKFVYKLSCGETLVTYIEPLFGALRHPLALCFGSAAKGSKHHSEYIENLLSRDYLVLDNKIAQMRKKEETECRNVYSDSVTKVGLDYYYLDVGASTWDQGAGGASQQWIVESYANASIDIHFNRFMMWEMQNIKPKKIFKHLPDQVFGNYQYYDIAAVPDPASPRNPLNLLTNTIRQKDDDFVLFKLDMDHPSENQFIEMLLEDEELSHIVDEMFMEHHVNFKPMLKYWKNTADMSKTLADSYCVFLKLRQRGIRMHGWP